MQRAAAVRQQDEHVLAVPLEDRWPDAVRTFADTVEDVLAFTGFPKVRWRQIWSNNPKEGLDMETRRGTDEVAGPYPNLSGSAELVGRRLKGNDDSR